MWDHFKVRKGGDKVNQCVVEKCEAVIRCEEDVKNLVGWQKNQNGSLKMANEKIDKLLFWMAGVVASAALSFLGTIIVLLTLLRGGGH